MTVSQLSTRPTVDLPAAVAPARPLAGGAAARWAGATRRGCAPSWPGFPA